jgi:type II secretory pathway component PulK
MKKGLMIALVALLVVAIAVPAAMALTDNQKAELEALYEQQHQLSQQILEKQVEAGLVDAEDAEAIRERMAQRWEYRQQRMSEGEYGFGRGRRGGRMGGGCGNCPNINGDSAAENTSL